MVFVARDEENSIVEIRVLPKAVQGIGDTESVVGPDVSIRSL